MASETFKLPEWDSGPLNLFLKRIFPLYISPYQRLDVQRLRADLVPSKSHEAVYKWLRNSRLTPENAHALRNLANTPLNIAARGGSSVVLHDFGEFVFPGTSGT